MNVLPLRRLLALLAALGVATVSQAAAPDATVDKLAKRYLGWTDLCAELQLKNIGKSGLVQEGASKTCALFTTDGSRYGRVTVLSPPVARGMDVLTRAELVGQISTGGKSQQWLYMPATQRATLINANNSESPFLGSEFSFADLDLAYLDPSGLKFVDEVACGGERCRRYAVRNTRGGAVTRTVWVTSAGAIKQIEIQKLGKPYKLLLVEHEVLHPSGWWVADRVVMRNLQTGARTESIWKNIKFNAGLKADNFDPKKIYGPAPSGRPR